MKFIKWVITFSILLPGFALADYQQGPVGGVSGQEFDLRIGSSEKICGLRVRSAARIDGMQLEICDEHGNKRLSQYVGGNGGTYRQVSFAPDEYINRVVYGLNHRDGKWRVVGMRVQTSAGENHEFGTTYYKSVRYHNWTHFPEGTEIRGFVGRANSEVVALGAYVEMPESDQLLNASPWERLWGGNAGGAGGTNFGDSIRSNERLCGVTVYHGNRIHGLQSHVCDANGQMTSEDFRGGKSGTRTQVLFDDDEYLVAINGWVGVHNSERIFGLVLKTNKRTYPTLGRQTNVPFEFVTPYGLEVHGFKGKAGGDLDAIGLQYRVDRNPEPPRADFIRHVSLNGDWLYKEWDSLPTVNSYDVTVVAQRDGTGETREYRSTVEGATNRGDYLYHYDHKNDMCNDLGWGYGYQLQEVTIQAKYNGAFSATAPASGYLSCEGVQTQINVQVNNYGGSGSLQLDGATVCTVAVGESSKTCSFNAHTPTATIRFVGYPAIFTECDSTATNSCGLTLSGGTRSVNAILIDLSGLSFAGP